MDPVSYIAPISQIAKEMNIELSSPKGQLYSVREVAQSVINKYVSVKLEWVDKKVHLTLDQNNSIFNLTACASTDIVKLPPLYFIAKDEALYFLATGKAPTSPLEEGYVPLSGPDDPRLDDELRLQAFANYISDKLGIIRKKITWEDSMYLRMYMTAIHNQSKKTINDTLSFIILHELGHVKNVHSARTSSYKRRLDKALYVIINVLTLGIFRQAALDLQSRKHEKEADRFAYRGLHAKPDGGIHLFKTTEEFKPKGCKETLAYAWLCFSTLFTHGSFAKRRERIERHLAKIDSKVL